MRVVMFDPLSVFFCMWILNSGLPPARLSVHEVIKVKEEKIVVDTIQKSVTIREI